MGYQLQVKLCFTLSWNQLSRKRRQAVIALLRSCHVLCTTSLWPCSSSSYSDNSRHCSQQSWALCTISIQSPFLGSSSLKQNIFCFFLIFWETACIIKQEKKRTTRIYCSFLNCPALFCLFFFHSKGNCAEIETFLQIRGKLKKNLKTLCCAVDHKHSAAPNTKVNVGMYSWGNTLLWDLWGSVES